MDVIPPDGIEMRIGFEPYLCGLLDRVRRNVPLFRVGTNVKHPAANVLNQERLARARFDNPIPGGIAVH